MAGAFYNSSSFFGLFAFDTHTTHDDGFMLMSKVKRWEEEGRMKENAMSSLQQERILPETKKTF